MTKQQISNDRLIAAAPELLEALKHAEAKLQYFIRDQWKTPAYRWKCELCGRAAPAPELISHWDGCAIKVAQDAITKAKGSDQCETSG